MSKAAGSIPQEVKGSKGTQKPACAFDGVHQVRGPDERSIGRAKEGERQSKGPRREQRKAQRGAERRKVPNAILGEQRKRQRNQRGRAKSAKGGRSSGKKYQGRGERSSSESSESSEGEELRRGNGQD